MNLSPFLGMYAQFSEIGKISTRQKRLCMYIYIVNQRLKSLRTAPFKKIS